MAVNDIIQLLLIGNSEGIPLISNFTYQQTAGGDASNLLVLCNQFVTDVLPTILPLVGNTSIFTEVSAKQLTGGSDVTTIALTTSNTGASSPPFYPPQVAAAFRYFRSTRASRNGAKRFGVISTINGTADGKATSGYRTAANTTADQLQLPLTNSGYVWTPRILRTRLNGATLEVPEVFSITSVGFIDLTSQNSRKFNKRG